MGEDERIAGLKQYLYGLVPRFGLDADSCLELLIALDNEVDSVLCQGAVCAFAWLNAKAALAMNTDRTCVLIVITFIGVGVTGRPVMVKLAVEPATIRSELGAQSEGVRGLFGAYPEELPALMVETFFLEEPSSPEIEGDKDAAEYKSSGEGEQNAHFANERDLFNHLIGRAGISESWGFPGGAGDDGEGSDGN